MVDNVRWADLLPSVATDGAPFVKSLGKFQDSLAIYGLGTGIAGLEGLNQIGREVRAAHAIWTRPDQEHVKPSLRRLAFGVLNVAGYGLYGAGAGGGLGRYGTGGGLLLVTASNVLKQHFLPSEEMYRPANVPLLPLHRSDVARYAQVLPPAPAPAPAPATPATVPAPDDRWLRAAELESGTIRPAAPESAPASGAGSVNSAVAAAAVGVPRRGRSRSLPDVKAGPPVGTSTARRGSAGPQRRG